ncbi:MAG TPA: UDP-N-acetylglucosamine--N-acetylmuramyl-(pentapeptide) pyrophosphoryl-undecaprenol N-acetylglucosamine transferase [Acidimicrobiia bacterium]|nr:UDP-N-acetylglucosamine--N-acetylmuramyl-(pentapeptide) pyrophosphoryl-undecaprenol N-acetylglucosamine transferase [Acidimicrobiia bacterium]
MAFAIAAAGTGGHVYPGLAVGEALVSHGVAREEILYIGGRRLEQSVYPQAGFPFLSVELAGLQRSLTPANLRLPRVVAAATTEIARELRHRQIKVVLGMGGYVSVPAGLAAGRAHARLFLHEQNAAAGLANRLLKRRAQAVFISFAGTAHLPRGLFTGNPVRAPLDRFDRGLLRSPALDRYQLDPEIPVLGVFGGSLGAAVINRAVTNMITSQPHPTFQTLQLTGTAEGPRLAALAVAHPRWRVREFEGEMQWFYAASDLVLARAGGAVAELTATATPAVLVPGGFGSGGHQHANAAALARVGAAEVIEEKHLSRLPGVIEGLLANPHQLQAMREAARSLARPQAAQEIAQILIKNHE